jgi:diacylglycerol kinase (ATP)
MGSRALLLLNPKARRGELGAPPAFDRLREAGFDLIEPTEEFNRFSEAVRAHAGKVDLVIAAGGDGTLTGAVDGLVSTGLPLGVLPLGTANDLARTLGLPADPIAAADVIIAGHQRRIDLGWVNDTHFFNVASIGLSTGITRKLSRESKSRWGVFAYAVAAFSVVTRARPFRAEIITGGETIEVKTVQIAVGNGRHYGGGLVIDAAATIDDATLHLVSLEVEHWWQMIPLMPRFRKGTLGASKRVRVLSGREFEVRPAKKRKKKVMADGELAGQAPAVFRVVPKALVVFAPGPAPALA